MLLLLSSKQINVYNDIFQLFHNSEEVRILIKNHKHVNLQDLCSSGKLCSIQWQFFTNISGHTIGPIFKVFFFLDTWPLKLGMIGYPEMLVMNYYHMLHNFPEEHRSHLLCGGSLKLCMSTCKHYYYSYINIPFNTKLSILWFHIKIPV
jgi:hypothetical protein